MQRARVAGKRHAAQRRKARGIGARDAERIAHARRLRPEHRMREHRIERRLQRLRARGVERLQRQAELRRQIEFRLQRREAALAAINFQPAGLAQVMRGARFRHQRLVLGHRARKQRADQPRGFQQTRRPRRRAERQQPGRHLRQKREMIIGLARALERDARQRRRDRTETPAGTPCCPRSRRHCHRRSARPRRRDRPARRSSPRLARCSAIEVPTMPAPSTMASVRAMESPFASPAHIWIIAIEGAIKAHQPSRAAGVFPQ